MNTVNLTTLKHAATNLLALLKNRSLMGLRSRKAPRKQLKFSTGIYRSAHFVDGALSPFARVFVRYSPHPSRPGRLPFPHSGTTP